MLEQLIIEDAPCLERLLLFGQGFREEMVISVISAPKLEILGQLPLTGLRLEFGATAFQVPLRPLHFHVLVGIQFALLLIFHT